MCDRASVHAACRAGDAEAEIGNNPHDFIDGRRLRIWRRGSVLPTKFAQVGFAQALDREFRQSGIKVSAICPGGVKTEFAIGKGRTEKGVAESEMLDPEDVAGVVVLACTQSPKSRIIEVQMRTMAEALA
jgi:NADP-dependent 3-hydroxy acid dehydrogenase YdfG